MRKITLELEPYEMIKEALNPMFEILDSFEILETLKIDWEDGIRVDLLECHLKETISIDDVKIIGDMEILSVLKSDGNKHTCLIKYTEPEESRDIFKEFNLNLINTIPFFVSEKKHIYSVIGENKSLTKYIELIKQRIGRIDKMSFKKAVYEKKDLLSILTDKQKEILITAHKFGYYNYPKKINSEKLSKKTNISKPTLLNHLRKAEGRIFDELLTGYS
jgi:predicted DNA binding protein